MKLLTVLFLSLTISFSVYSQPKIYVDVNQKGVRISPTHYGIFFEDINHAADGGLYAELIRNRSFEDAQTPECWSLITTQKTSAEMSIETKGLLNTSQAKCLKLQINKNTPDQEAGVSNTGYWGINVVKGRKYKLSFFAKSLNFNGAVFASLRSKGGKVYAKAKINSIDTNWKKYTCTFIANANDSAACFAITTPSTGTLWLDVVSLFPPTFNNRENGLRPELAQLLSDMNPTFMRFPGGCFVEGDTLKNRFEWKKTIGKIEERPGHKNLWGYRTTDGMGYHEFLQLCEDLHAEPLYVVNVGIAHKDHNDYTNNNDYLTDALDALEYANGDIKTKYGALRAANGHPKPFNIKYLEIGNENFKGDNYAQRYEQFYKEIKKRYPEMICIANVVAWGSDNPVWPHSAQADLLDEHYYRSPQWFINQYQKYDTYDRNGMKIYVGEYAVTKNCGLGNLDAAIGEAVYMQGMEKNSDIVRMNSYAPIFVNVHDRKWSPDLINFNASKVYCTPSYYVQKLFANNLGTVNVSVKDTSCTKTNILNGAIGIGTNLATAEFSDFSITGKNGKSLLIDTLHNNNAWFAKVGDWHTINGVCSQSTLGKNCLSTISMITDSVYAYRLKVRKTSGKDGVQIIFGYKDNRNYYRWNIGPNGNTIDRYYNGLKSTLILTSNKNDINKWCDIRIDVNTNQILFYMDNQLTHTLDISTPLLYTSATLDEKTNQLYIKVVNPTDNDISTDFCLKNYNMKGAKVSAQLTTLCSDKLTDENSLQTPQKVSPTITIIPNIDKEFSCKMKRNSVNVFKIAASSVK